MSGPIVLGLRLLMALALYGFLGWAVLVIWREVNMLGMNLSGRRAPAISLTLIPENEPGISKHFSQSEIILGRDPGCDLQLADDTVSARHSQLAYHHGQWWIMDLTSKNGTLLNGAPVKIPTVLTSGDEIRCGNASLRISMSPGTILFQTRKGQN
jgi:pSer/pThr/pTyr-binding forkhead associated (FHA) protein